VRPDLMELLCCPLCHGDLALEVKQKTGEEIVEGTLTCTKCKTLYPIEDGIPNLLPPEDRDP
jgi:uncharacterized protein YbaR (Trm112 family)